MENQENDLLTKPPLTGSTPLVDYLWSERCDLRLLHFVIDTVLTGDYVAHVARQALDGKNDYESTSPGDLASSNPGQRTLSLRKSSQELLEMFLARVIDNFQVYLVDIIRDVLRLKPEILSARKQEFTLGQILKYKTIEDLVQSMIEGKIGALSYEGFGYIQEWCDNKGIPLIVPENKLYLIIELISVRNIIIHNRGRVDSRYLIACSKSTMTIGEKFPLKIDYLFESSKLLNDIVNLTDKAITDKFHVNSIDVNKELNRRSSERL